MSELGRRDRKKQQTRSAIEQAAVTLVAESGLNGVTIEAIAERADVTTRTFFNHFADKESAILGIARDVPTPFTASADGGELPEGDPLEVGLALLRGLLQSMDVGHPGITDARRTILAEHPELLGRQVERYVVVEDQLNATMARVLERDGVPEPMRRRQARAATFLLTAAARLAVEDWCREPAEREDPSARLDEAMATLRVTAQGRST